MTTQRKNVINLKDLKQNMKNKKQRKSDSIISFETEPEDEISFMENESLNEEDS